MRQGGVVLAVAAKALDKKRSVARLPPHGILSFAASRAAPAVKNTTRRGGAAPPSPISPFVGPRSQKGVREGLLWPHGVTVPLGWRACPGPPCLPRRPANRIALCFRGWTAAWCAGCGLYFYSESYYQSRARTNGSAAPLFSLSCFGQAILIPPAFYVKSFVPQGVGNMCGGWYAVVDYRALF